MSLGVRPPPPRRAAELEGACHAIDGMRLRPVGQRAAIWGRAGHPRAHESSPSGKARVNRTPRAQPGRHSLSRGLMTGWRLDDRPWARMPHAGPSAADRCALVARPARLRPSTRALRDGHRAGGGAGYDRGVTGRLLQQPGRRPPGRRTAGRDGDSSSMSRARPSRARLRRLGHVAGGARRSATAGRREARSRPVALPSAWSDLRNVASGIGSPRRRQAAGASPRGRRRRGGDGAGRPNRPLGTSARSTAVGDESNGSSDSASRMRRPPGGRRWQARRYRLRRFGHDDATQLAVDVASAMRGNVAGAADESWRHLVFRCGR